MRREPELEKILERQNTIPVEEYHVSELEDNYELKDIAFELPRAIANPMQNDPRVHILSEADYAAISFIDSESSHYEVALGIETQDRVDKIENREYESFSISPFMRSEDGGDIIRKYNIPVAGESRLEFTAKRLEEKEERLNGESMVIKALNGGEELFEMTCRRRKGNGWTYIARQNH